MSPQRRDDDGRWRGSPHTPTLSTLTLVVEWSDMRLPHRKSSMGRGGGRGLRWEDRLPRLPMELVSRASLAKTESAVNTQELGAVD
uniref:Uncharacterized protein n=1 Tax=Oryza glumipatula TaxID=40148 RepID=A0A0E0AHX9_9ORYZ